VTLGVSWREKKIRGGGRFPVPKREKSHKGGPGYVAIVAKENNPNVFKKKPIVHIWEHWRQERGKVGGT